jgi:SAM-dependent methyltransferase
MPSRSSACEPSSARRAEVAEDLYLSRGSGEAAFRCDANQTFGEVDLFSEIARALRIASNHVVVDVCCGAGQHALRYAALAFRAIGYDFSRAAVESARARGSDAHVADAAFLPLDDGSVDCLACTFGVYYLSDVEAALCEWKRVLAVGGRIAVSGPARGTNAELYAFHAEATGEGPSDADTMALGYVEDVVFPALVGLGFSDVRLTEIVNPVRFPDAAAFLEYWRSTSLFLRSKSVDFERGRSLLAGHRGTFEVVKRVTIVSGTRG